MKLENETLQILQNFQTINQSIVIRPGNTLTTLSPSKTVCASATVPNDFPTEFAIYDISKFLGILSLNKDADIEFFDKHMMISHGKSKIKFVYCSPSLVVSPPEGKTIKIDDSSIVFELTSEVLSKVMKAMQILGFKEIEFSGDGQYLTVSAISSKDDSSNMFSTEIGETDKTFSAIIESEKMKLLPSNYTVTISEKTNKMAHFKCDTVEYWIALSVNSKF